MKYFFIVLSLALLGCPPKDGHDPVIPTPRPPPTDTADCGKACDHMKELHCPEGEPLEDGTSCQKFCEDTQNSGHALNPSCIVKITTCKQIETTCAR